MSLLPANFPVEQLSTVGISKLEWYYRIYVQEYYTDYKFGHFLLASYASVPALLTPDLLYKIWQNFNAYKWQGIPASIHPIAVSDILLSPLCVEVGYELYEMEQEIKLAFLEWLKKIEADKVTLWGKRNIENITNIAKFSSEYHALPNSGHIRWGKSYTEWQEVEALSYDYPEEAASRLLNKMTEQSADHKEMDLLRTMDQFIKTQKKLERLYSGDDSKTRPFYQNVTQLEAVKNLLENNSNALLEKLENNPLPNLRTGTGDSGIPIKMPTKVQEKLTEKLTQKNKGARKKIFAGVIGIDEFPGFAERPFSFCNSNARRFASALESYSNALDRDIEIHKPVSNQFNQEDLQNLYEFYRQAVDGDSCVFFYSGMGLMDNQYRVRDVVVSGDTRENLNREGGRAGLTQQLNNLFRSKNIHMLIITDIHGVVRIQRTFPAFNETQGEGSLVFLKNFDKDDDWLSNAETGIYPPEVNSFCHFLFALLSEGSYRFTYHEIFTQLKLRMSSQGGNRPAKYCFPEIAAQRMFLTGEEKKINSYLLSYNRDIGWNVNAGSRQGIRPSLSFMETLFRDVSGERYGVETVFEEYSTIRNFEASTEKTFPLTLVQNALPKIKVAFAEAIDPEMRERLLSSVGYYDIYYIELVEDQAAAYYLIGNHEREYMLTIKEKIRLQEQVPVFDYQEDPFEFIKAMEYIAQWQGVLEFDNRETLLTRDQVWFEFEKIEGVALSDINDSLTGEWVPDYEPVVLYYRKIGNSWVQPSFRCRATRIQRPVYVSVLYLDSEYGITIMGTTLVKPGEQSYIAQFDNGRGMSYTIPLRIPRYFLEKNITEVTEYIKFFVSESPIDIESLKQKNLVLGSQPIMRKGISVDPDKKDSNSLDTTHSDWVAVTIPITLVQKETSPEKLPPKENPFKGLTPYTEDDASILFGRERLVDTITRAAQEYKIIIISGQPGSGKTSLINAGLIPRLAPNAVKLSIEIPLNLEALRRDVERIQETENRKFIFVDNYEYLLQTSAEDSENFERVLQELAYSHTIVIAIRTDAEIVIFRHSRLVRLIRARGSGKVIRPSHSDAWRIEMPVPTSQDLNAIIRSSLRQASIAFDDNLINAFVKDVLQVSLPLPFLSSILYQLAQKGAERGRRLSLQDYSGLDRSADAKAQKNQFSFEDKVEEISRGRIVSYADDPQKGRWGGKSESNGKILRASISPTDIGNLYRLRATIVSTSKRELPDGAVAFFLSEDFDREVEFSSFAYGQAHIEKTIYEPFTIGAITEDGTLLELNLADQAPFTKDFYLENVPDNFEKNVRTLYRSRSRSKEDDPQKGRWGGEAMSGDKEIIATVEESQTLHYFKVHLIIKSYQSADHLSGSAAFFLDESYNESIIFRKAVNGEISLTITAYQAFTVGAYTADETLLELDLNQVPGFPENFYYRENPA